MQHGYDYSGYKGLLGPQSMDKSIRAFFIVKN